MEERSDPDSRWPFFFFTPRDAVAVERILEMIHAHVVCAFLARVRSDKSLFRKIRRAGSRVHDAREVQYALPLRSEDTTLFPYSFARYEITCFYCRFADTSSRFEASRRATRFDFTLSHNVHVLSRESRVQTQN